eukprot:8713605-Pyramimonas_sp.AAC.1
MGSRAPGPIDGVESSSEGTGPAMGSRAPGSIPRDGIKTSSERRVHRRPQEIAGDPRNPQETPGGSNDPGERFLEP